MSEEKFDVIVVGAGPAGLTAAYFLAKKGLETLVIERGVEPGSKNVFGGRIYSYVLDKYFPGWRKEAPVERWVRRERISLICDDSKAITIEYSVRKLLSNEYDSFTAFLTKFVSWLAEKVEEAGAVILTSTKVDEILFSNGIASGIIAGGEKLEADYIIIAEGANSLLSEKIGIRKKPHPRHVALGIKEVIRLGRETINSRFGVRDWEGVAHFIIGRPLEGLSGGAFMYTMGEYVSLGIVVRLEAIKEAKIAPRDVIERVRLHPFIKELLKDGVLVEYSAHLTRELGIHDVLEKPYGPGYLVVGDAAGFILNTGFTIRGVDLAMESGRLAAEAIAKAHGEGSRDEKTLSYYKKLLDNSIIVKNMKKFSKTPFFLENKRIYSVYPEIVCEAFSAAYTVAEEAERIYPKILEATKKHGIGLLTLLRDLWKARDAV